jgi:trehalose synthase-fused probable maltokinase
MTAEDGGRRAEGADLLEFLRTQRWFGEKGRAIESAELRDIVPVHWPNSRKEFAVARARVVTDEGPAMYQLFLVRAPDARHPLDALEDPEFLRGLADGFAGGSSFEDGGVRWVLASDGKIPLTVPTAAPIALSETEQSNSSVILNREAILKLYRKLQPGIHPDVEVTRFLTLDRRFVHVPVLLGTIRFEDAEGETVAGMMQEYVQGAVDGWTFALDASADFFRSGKIASGEIPFVKEAAELGEVTRALHEALASGESGSEFDRRDATADDLRRWTRGAEETARRALASLERALVDKKLAGGRGKEAQAIAARGPQMVARIGALADAIGRDAGVNARTHGDYHLGQVLRSAAQRFLIIDFEGEPARPLAARRARSSPLRDVAGMLRSFAYAAATAHDEARGVAWERAARDAFLRGYLTAAHDGQALFPRARENTDRLVALFEVEKVFYELQYELDHRPDWAWIPLRGLSRLAP